MPQMSRIEGTALLKSLIIANVPPEEWSGRMAVASGCLDTHCGELVKPPAQSPTIQSEPKSTGEAKSVPVTLTLEAQPEFTQGKHGPRARVQAGGYKAGKWFSAFGRHADDMKRIAVGSRFECTVVVKPNPGGRDYLNLEDIKEQIPF